MDDIILPQLINPATGEILKPNQLTPKLLNSVISTFSNQKISEFLTQVNFFKRCADRIEKALKETIKDSVVDFNDENVAEFEDHKISKITRKAFSEKKLMTKGNDVEKAMWLSLKDKYTETSEYIKID